MSSTYDAYKQAMEKIATLQEVHVKKTVSVQSRLIKQMQDRNLQCKVLVIDADARLLWFLESFPS